MPADLSKTIIQKKKLYKLNIKENTGSRSLKMIRGENISINEVQHDLELMTQWPRYGISLSWQSSEPEILENDGTLHTEKLGKKMLIRNRSA